MAAATSRTTATPAPIPASATLIRWRSIIVARLPMFDVYGVHMSIMGHQVNAVNMRSLPGLPVIRLVA
jgi:hypothetical protein